MAGMVTRKIDKPEIRQFLSRIWAFELLDPDHLDELATLVTTRHLREGEVLWLQGQAIDFFTIVFDGQLRSVRRTSTGSEKLVSTLRRGHHFGLAEMITGATSTTTILAAKGTTILTMDQRAMEQQLLSNAEICYRLMQTMARAIFSLTRELERASFENVHTRLARLLMRRSRGLTGPGHRHISGANVSHEELAIQLGVSRETVSRALSDFKRRGLIETGYRTTKVLDRDGLMAYIEDFDQW